MRKTDLSQIGGFLLVLAATWLAPGVVHAQASIVHEGEVRAEIVIAEEPAPIVPVAARELQKQIERISGATLPIVSERSDDGRVAIFVGQSRYTDELGLDVAELDYDAYRMASGEDWLALLGRDDDFQMPEPWPRSKYDRERVFEQIKEQTGLHLARLPVSRVGWRNYYEAWDLHENDGRGSFNAVHAFLRDLGFRRFFPGELGEVVPKHASIALPEVDKEVHPDFAMRKYIQYYHQWGRPQATDDEVTWQLSLGLNTGYELRGLGAMGHGLSSITQGRYRYSDHDKRVEFNKQHPEEFYALYDGKRDIGPEGGNQCLSSEKLFETTVEYARAMFDIYDVRVLDLSPDDGFGRLCECEDCQARATPERGRSGSMSDHVWGFVNRVAEEVYKTHPDRYITCLAYTSYLLPPEDIEQLSPNMAVGICTWRTWQLSDSGQYSTENLRALRQAWLDKMPSKMLMRWDYYLHAGREGSRPLPAVFPRLIAEDMSWLKGRVVGEHIEVFRNYDGWERDWHALAVNHLNLYVTARYHWDVEQDIDALLEDYYAKFYGPAREEMQAFIEYAEQHWNNAKKDHEIIDRLFELLEAAQAAADDAENDVYRERIDMIAKFIAPLERLGEQLATGRLENREGRIRPRGDAELTFDGHIDDEFWDYPWYHLKDVETGEWATSKTQFRLATDGEDIYMAVRCWDDDMANLNVGTTRDDSYDIWNGDVVELLLETDEHRYYQIAFNPAGAVTDLDRGNGQGVSWSSDAEVKVQRHEEYWTAEVRLPWPGAGHAEFFPNEKISGGEPTETVPWFFNVCRQRVRDGEKELSSFEPAGEGGFHDVMKFGPLYMR